MPTFRTNSTGAEMTFEITGTSVIGFRFDTSYQDNLSEISGYLWQPARFCAKWCALPSGLDDPFSDREWSKPLSAEGTQVLVEGLDPSKTYGVKMSVCEPANVVDAVTREPIFSVERHREPEEGLTSRFESGDPFDFGVSGRFCELDKIICSSGATVSAFSYSNSELPVLILSDLVADATAIGSGGKNSSVPQDFIRQGCKDYVDGLVPTKHLNVINSSCYRESGLRIEFPAVLGDNVLFRSSTDYVEGRGFDADTGAYVETEKRFSHPGYLTADNLNNTEASPSMGPGTFNRLTWERVYASAFTPEVVVISLCASLYNNQVISDSWSSFMAGTVVDLIQKVKQAWPSVKVALASPHFASGINPPGLLDSTVRDIILDVILTSKILLDGTSIGGDVEVIDVWGAVAAAPESLGEFGPVLTQDQHDYLASAVSTTLGTLGV